MEPIFHNIFLFKVIYWYWHHRDDGITKMIVLNLILFTFSAYVLVFGPLCYILTLRDFTFVQILIDISQLASCSVALYIVFHIKFFTYKTGRETVRLIGENWRCSFDNCHIVRALSLYGKLLKASIVACFICVLIGFVVKELEDCELSSQPFSCGYIFSSYYFVEMDRPLRDIVNFCIAIACIYVLIPLLDCFFILLFKLKYLEVIYMDMIQSLRELKLICDEKIRHETISELYTLQLFVSNQWTCFYSMFQFVITILTFCSSLIIATSFVAIMTTFNLVVVLQIILYSISIFFYGSIGEKLINMNDRYRNEIYFACPWDGDVKTCKYLMLMHLNSNDRIVLKLGRNLKYSNELVYLLFRLAYTMVTMWVNQ